MLSRRGERACFKYFGVSGCGFSLVLYTPDFFAVLKEKIIWFLDVSIPKEI